MVNIMQDRFCMMKIDLFEEKFPTIPIQLNSNSFLTALMKVIMLLASNHLLLLLHL